MSEENSLEPKGLALFKASIEPLDPLDDTFLGALTAIQKVTKDMENLRHRALKGEISRLTDEMTALRKRQCELQTESYRYEEDT